MNSKQIEAKTKRDTIALQEREVQKMVDAGCGRVEIHSAWNTATKLFSEVVEKAFVPAIKYSLPKTQEDIDNLFKVIEKAMMKIAKGQSMHVKSILRAMAEGMLATTKAEYYI